MKQRVITYLTNGGREEFICKHWYSDGEYGFVFAMDNDRNGKWVIPASSIACFYYEDYKDKDLQDL